MSLSDLEVSWTNHFSNQDITIKIQNRDHKNMCCMPDLPQPRPQRTSFDVSFLCDDDCEGQYQEHHLESALKDMMDNGELEDFLSSNTISLKQIQDDINVDYSPKSLSEFSSKPRQRRHSIGSAEELIRCPFPGCDKIFNRAYNFKSHVKVHSGEKPFKCAHCELNFARCHDLKRHEKIHNKDSKSENWCDFCGKKFSRPDALTRHIKLNACQKNLFSGLKNLGKI